MDKESAVPFEVSEGWGANLCLKFTDWLARDDTQSVSAPADLDLSMFNDPHIRSLWRRLPR